MTQFLPPNLLSLFAPREPIPYLPPLEKLPFEKKTTGYNGIAEFINLFEDPKDTPAPVKIETREERLQRKKREKAEKAAYKLEQGIALWDPHNISTATSDPYKTLFVARINYDTSEAKLRREFETYGPIKKVSLVMDKVTGKPRGYAFIEYEHERDMRAAFKHADGKKIDGRRVLVDVERGRTVKGWLPRRLGGGLGGDSRKPGYEEGSVIGSHREDSFGASRRADSRERSDSGFRSNDRRERRRSPSDRLSRDHNNGSRRRSRSPLSRERRDRDRDRDREPRRERRDRPRDLKE